MPDLGFLSNTTTTATALSNLILVSPTQNLGYQAQPLGGIGPLPPGFLFDYEGENAVAITSDITDHFVEDNTALQDQISLKPDVITVHGFVSELNDIAPPALAGLKTIANKLIPVTAYTPDLTLAALIAYQQAAFLYSTAQVVKAAAVSAWSSISGSSSSAPNQNKQQLAFQKFYGYWQNRTLFTVQTPWAVFNNMAITSLRAIQNEDTRMVSDFEIQFKKIRFATTQTVSAADVQGQLAAQSAEVTNNGTKSATPDASLGSKLGG